jgi:hypothetical protein
MKQACGEFQFRWQRKEMEKEICIALELSSKHGLHRREKWTDFFGSRSKQIEH